LTGYTAVNISVETLFG